MVRLRGAGAAPEGNTLGYRLLKMAARNYKQVKMTEERERNRKKSSDLCSKQTSS